MNFKLRAGRAGRFLFLAMFAAGLLAAACGSASEPPPVNEVAAPAAVEVAPARSVNQEPAVKAAPANPAQGAKPGGQEAAAEAMPDTAVESAQGQPAAPAEPVEPAAGESSQAAAVAQAEPVAPIAPAAPAAAEPEPEPVAEVEPAAPAVPLPEIGHQVGYRIPDFTLELAAGGTVTAADLTAAGRPTFLFFFATT